MASVIEINDLHSLGAYRMQWNALMADTPRASFFHTFDWLSIYWRHFGGDQKLRVLIVEAAGKVIGIVPLCVRREKRSFGHVRVLTYPLEGWGMWYSPIGSAQAATLAMAMRHISQTPRDWDLIDLPWTDSDLSDRGRTARAMNTAGLTCHQQQDESTSVIELAGDWEGYLASRTRKTRHEIRRTRKRLEEQGTIEYVRHRPEPLRAGDGEPNWSLYDECEEVARHSWQADLIDGNTISHERYRPFLRKAHEAAAALGMLDVNLLRVNGRAVAFNYNYHFDGVVFGLRMGYRADFPNKGAGSTLVMMTVEDSFARGDRRFELGVGDQAYKHRIRTHEEFSHRLTHAPITSWRSQAVRLSRWMKSRQATQKVAS
ncbi:MAG: GNAT family N-acetyltransferase [Planctomycetota bacterium]